MTWQTETATDWRETVLDLADAQDDDRLAGLVQRMELVPAGYDPDAFKAIVHHGPLWVSGDFTQPGLIAAIDGDLTVAGKVTTESVEGADGNATLIVFGDLQCRSLVNDWASIVIVTGDCTVDDWIFAAREDSSFIVGGALRTPIFVGADIWVSVGGAVEIETGHGYAVDLSHGADAFGAPQIHPRTGWRTLVSRLALDRHDPVDEFDLVEKIEERLFATGSILPSDQ